MSEREIKNKIETLVNSKYSIWTVGITDNPTRRKDEHGNPWVAVTVQGDGAYLWGPNKEHQSDEPDSMLISVTVRKA